MALQAVGTSNFLSASLGNNPVQTIGMLGITVLAVNALSNLPMAKADEGGFPWREYCEVQCTPITGEKTATHQICVETCLVGKEMIKTTTEQMLKNGKWEVVKTIGKVIAPFTGYLECTSVCDTGSAILQEGGLMARSGWNFLKGDRAKAASDAAQAAAKAACTASLLLPGGYAICMSCCAAIKYAGVV
jgi:hypothetical protein